MTDTPTVHQAIASVMREMAGVGKNQRNKEQGYNFRGIDDVLKELHPLLAKHGVVFCPDVVEREYEERVSAKGTVGHCAHLHVRYKVYGPAGDFVELSTWGEGLDYGDKSTNKAATAAFKYALFELFAVSDPADDGDHDSPEDGRTTRSSGTVRRPPRADPETGEIITRKARFDRMLAMMTQAQMTTADERLRYSTNVIGREIAKSAEMTDDEIDQVAKNLEAMLESEK